MNALVRLEQPSDAAAIDHVLRSAFPTDQEGLLVNRLRRHQRLRLSLVAAIDDVIVGHIAFSRVTIAESVARSTGFGLAPLTILPELQRQGLGIDEGLCACERLGPDSLSFLARLSITSGSALEVRIFLDWRMNTARAKNLWR
jgi:putative acetyltransferase